MPTNPTFLDGGGEMGALMRAHDWAASPLGPPTNWPQSLRTAIRVLLNTGHPMYVWWGPQLLCFYNDAYRRSIGPERHPGSLGRPAREVWSEIWPIIGPQIDQVMTGGGATWQENALIPITRNGVREEVFWTYSYGPIDDEAAPNGVGGVLVVCTETTEQVLTGRHAAQDVERLSRLFAQAPGFMAMLSGPDHVFELANPAYISLVGRRDLIGKSVRAAFPDLEGQGFFELLDGVFASGEAYSTFGAPVTLQATPEAPARARLIDFVYQPIKGPGGVVTGIFVEGADVTERAEADAALRESEALMQSRKLEAIGQLTGGIAHDFNNLLMAILGSLEMVQKRLAPDPRIDRLINNAVQGAQRGAVLTQRMLAFARRQELKREPIDLAALVLGMNDLLNQTLGPLYTLKLELAPQLPAVDSDAAQLESALLNIVINARDAMPRGGTITVTADRAGVAPGAPDLAAGDYVRLRIIDQGEGMSEEALAHATEPFFTTKGVGKGTGLGLAMIHGLMQQTGGALRLKSGLDVGAEVELWLPLADRPADVPQSTLTAAPAPAGGRALKILAVDDDELVLLNTAAMLEDLGHTVVQASSADEALRALSKLKALDLMITDQIMPKMTGLQLAKEVAAARPDLPVVLATGYAEAPSEDGEGVTRLSKPFGLRQLSDAIARALPTA